MLAEYDALISKARSLNEVNRIHIAFANTITPLEVVALNDVLFISGRHEGPSLRADCRFSLAELKATARDWIDKLILDLECARKDTPEPFLRRDLHKSVTLYTDGGNAGDKTLLVTLPGSNHRLMMPIPTFLQNVCANYTDVLIVRAGARSDYTAALDGLASSVMELGAVLKGLVQLDGYHRLTGLGVSAGGLPIMLLATQLGFETTLSCGGGSPYDDKWKATSIVPEKILKDAIAQGFRGKLVAAFGAQSDADRKSARDLAECLSIEPVAIGIAGFDIRHNIMHPLAQRRQLQGFLAEHLSLRQ